MRRMTTKVVYMLADVLSGQRGRPILQGEQTSWLYKLMPDSGLKGLWGTHYGVHIHGVEYLKVSKRFLL